MHYFFTDEMAYLASSQQCESKL